MSFFKRLVSGCWFVHDLHRGRDASGRATEACVLCGWSRVVLGEAAIIGPAHTFKPDLGARTDKATTAKVASMRKRA